GPRRETDPAGTWQSCARSCGSCGLLAGGGWQDAAARLVAECESNRWVVDGLQAKIDALPDGSPQLLAEVVANSTEFREHLWERCPFVLRGPQGDLAELTLGSALEMASSGDLRKGARNTFMDANVKEEKLHSFRLDYSGAGDKLGSEDVLKKMKKGTWVVSSVHSLHPAAGRVTLAYQHAFGWPTSSNMYATLSGFSTSAPAHTDRTESFRLQCNGEKRWRVWAPKVLYPVSGVHEDGQWGKGYAQLRPEQMGPLMIDHNLLPGEVGGYMPRGFAHHTSTPSQGPAGRGVEEPSDVLRDTSVTLALTIITEQYEERKGWSTRKRCSARSGPLDSARRTAASWGRA
ncbi:unnamed protein product, partial [Prorocentrum cordatum]